MSFASGILSSLNKVKVTRDAMKITGLKKSIDFFEKIESRRLCVDGKCVMSGQDSVNEIKAETNFKLEK